MIDIYKYNSYVGYLVDDVAANAGIRGYHRQLAAAAGCAAPYLSSVMRGKCHLLPDHGFGLGQFWGFNAEQAEFFMLLLQHARASKKTYRDALAQQIKTKRRAQESLATRSPAAEQLDEKAALLYYRHWSVAAIHVATSIDRLQTPAAIAAALLLPPRVVSGCLELLVALGLVVRQGDRYTRAVKSLHVAADSPLNTINHINWRNKLLADGVSSREGGFNYSAVFALSRDDYDQVRQELYALFDRLHAIVADSKEETLAAICLDLAPLV